MKEFTQRTATHKNEEEVDRVVPTVDCVLVEFHNTITIHAPDARIFISFATRSDLVFLAVIRYWHCVRARIRWICSIKLHIEEPNLRWIALCTKHCKS